jgi:hypothetical protein
MIGVSRASGRRLAFLHTAILELFLFNYDIAFEKRTQAFGNMLVNSGKAIFQYYYFTSSGDAPAENGRTFWYPTTCGYK